jgi:hypothetical protein
MGDEKAKNSQYKTEFSFNFSGLAEKVGSMFEGMGGEPSDSSYSALRDGVTSARLRLKTGVGSFTVAGNADPAELISVDARHMGSLVFAISDKDGERTVRLEPEGSFRGGLAFGSKHRSLHTTVAINPEVPTHLKLHPGLGESHFDLSATTLTGFSMEGGVGAVKLILPNSEEGYKTSIEGGLGGAVVQLPAENPAKISVEGGVGELNIYIPANADLKASIEGGLGGLNIHVAEGTALRVEREKGLGGFNLPADLSKVKDNVFQTDGFDLAARSVTLKVEGGLGAVTVKWHDDDQPIPDMLKEKAKPKNDEMI